MLRSSPFLCWTWLVSAQGGVVGLSAVFVVFMLFCLLVLLVLLVCSFASSRLLHLARAGAPPISTVCILA